MKYFLPITIGIALALLESVARVRLFSVGFNLFFVALIALPFLVSHYHRLGVIIFLSGAIVLDLFSPYRMGLYLLSSVIVLAMVEAILSRSFEISNPLIAWLIMFVCIFVLNLFELLVDPSPLAFLVSIVANSIIATIITVILVRLEPSGKDIVRISDNVNFR